MLPFNGKRTHTFKSEHTIAYHQRILIGTEICSFGCVYAIFLGEPKCMCVFAFRLFSEHA